MTKSITVSVHPGGVIMHTDEGVFDSVTCSRATEGRYENERGQRFTTQAEALGETLLSLIETSKDVANSQTESLVGRLINGGPQ